MLVLVHPNEYAPAGGLTDNSWMELNFPKTSSPGQESWQVAALSVGIRIRYQDQDQRSGSDIRIRIRIRNRIRIDRRIMTKYGWRHKC